MHGYDTKSPLLAAIFEEDRVLKLIVYVLIWKNVVIQRVSMKKIFFLTYTDGNVYVYTKLCVSFFLIYLFIYLLMLQYCR